MKIQLKRSGVLDGSAAKEPTASQMEYGELAVNYNNGDPAVFLKDSTDTVIRIAGRGATGLDGDYVNITGDTMTGDLNLGNSSYLRVRKTGDDSSTAIQLGPDGSAEFASTVVVAPGNGRQIELANSPAGGVIYLRENDGTRNIQLDGANGSATFAGQVDCSSDGNNVASLVTNGYFQSDRTAGTSSVFEGQLNGTSTVSIVASGAGTFAGDITLGDYATNGSTKGIKLNPDNNGNGALVVQGGGTSDMAIGVYDGVAKTYKASVFHDGSATFTGPILGTNNAAVGGYLGSCLAGVQSNSNGYLFWGGTSTDESDRTVSILPDGSATFAGTLTVSENINGLKAISAAGPGSTPVVRVYSDTLSEYTTDLYADGSAKFSDNTTIFAGINGGSAVFYGGDSSTTDQNNAKFRLNSGGSASFADKVTSGSSTIRGQFLGNCPSSITASSADAFVADYNGTTVARVKYDGSASFAGYVRSDRFTTKAGISLQLDGTDYAFAAYQDSTNPLATIGVDGSAEFASTVQTDSWFQSNRTDGSGSVLYGLLNDVPTVNISADGSASFSGSVESTVQDAYSFRTNGGGLYANGSTGVALFIKNSGAYPVVAANDSNNGKLQLGNGNSSAYLITLDGNDGSAEFASTITAGGYSMASLAQL